MSLLLSSALRHATVRADNTTVARKDSHRDSRQPPEEERLSTRMRDLIRIATVEERRAPENEEQPGPNGERRRRTDEASEERRAS